MNRSSRSNSKG